MATGRADKYRLAARRSRRGYHGRSGGSMIPGATWPGWPGIGGPT